MEAKEYSCIYYPQLWVYQVPKYEPILQTPAQQGQFYFSFAYPASYQFLNASSLQGFGGNAQAYQLSARVSQSQNGVQPKPSSDIKQRNRNMISNSLKVFRKFLKDSDVMGEPFIQKIIQKNNLDYTAQQFLQTFDKMIPQKKNYIGSKYINQLIYSQQMPKNFKLILRSALFQYYRNSSYPTVLSSKKIIGESKWVQLSAGRKMLRQITNT